MTPEDFQNVSKQDIDKFLYFLKYDLDNSPKTRNRKLATLKKFFEYMYNNNYITNNPTNTIIPSKYATEVTLVQDIESYKKIIKTLSEKVQDLE